MISKPILIAASVASAQAALMALAATPVVQAAATERSDLIGCGKCLSFGVLSKYIVGGANTKYLTRVDGASIAVVGGAAADYALTGEICCGSATTKEGNGTPETYCTNLYGNHAITTKNTYIVIAATEYFQSALAQCPHNTVNCTALAFASATDAAFTGPMATAIATDPRLITLTKATSKVGYGVTLSMISQQSSAIGVVPALKQRIGDVCTWVVASECDAPVITVDSSTDGAALWDIQVTEWSAEFLTATAQAPQGVTWTAATQAGATAKKHYPPLTATITAAVTDLQLVATTKTTPNNIMGDVKFKTPVTTGTTFLSVPGNTLVDWMTNIKAVYAQYDAEKVKYDAEAATWKTYALYNAPEPGLFDWAFGTPVDPAKPATVSSPLMPTQPVDKPATIKSLKVSAALAGATATTSPAIYGGKAGYGYPSAYKITVLAGKSGKPFGTLAGKGQFATQTVDWAPATESIMSVRKTSNKKADGTYAAACDKSYLFITGVLATAPGAAVKTVVLKVTASEFQKTLEEQIPTRPGIANKPVDAPAGAAQLAASAVAAALTALYLF